METVLDWFCKSSPAMGASALGAISLIALVLWRGGTVDTIKIPGIFDVKLSKPLVFGGSKIMAALACVALAGALGLGGLQVIGNCDRCSGLPGETAWIYVGEFVDGKFISTVPIEPESKGVAPQDVPKGSWITLTQPRKTMINDWSSTKTLRALDSPFDDMGRHVSYTCKVLPIGQRLFIADRQFLGPGPNDRHLWLRVRLTPPG